MLLTFPDPQNIASQPSHLNTSRVSVNQVLFLHLPVKLFPSLPPSLPSTWLSMLRGRKFPAKTSLFLFGPFISFEEENPKRGFGDSCLRCLRDRCSGRCVQQSVTPDGVKRWRVGRGMNRVSSDLGVKLLSQHVMLKHRQLEITFQKL